MAIKFRDESLTANSDVMMTDPTIDLDKGGIDFNPQNMNLEIQNSWDEIKFNLDPAMLAQLQNASGFVPVIINMQPVINLKNFLETP